MARRGVSEGRGGRVSFAAMLGRRVRSGLAVRFRGVAATTAVDRQGDCMTEAALEGLAAAQQVPLLERHGGRPIGVVERCWVEDGKLRVEGQLKPGLVRLRGRGLSVGGRVREVNYGTDARTGRRVRRVEAAELDHVAVCHQDEAQNTETWVETLVAAGGSEGKTGQMGVESGCVGG